MGMISEFKEFAMKGSLVDMAVGIIIGGAVGKMVSSLVEDVIMPPIGVLMGGVDFSDLSFVIQKAPEVAIKYGAFAQTLIDFIIIAFVIFIMIKVINKANRNKEVEEEEAAPTSEDLLTEIRDLLKKG
ncbi:MAG TPA: large-conductance mechanosensitive channel protein MscL [Leucothrix mucor]|uniref:Large-conductance mechanosensitive channel n=1 Tax=Leucothrix mucor TaxID=45248 RepID=A0A7V2WTR1_LEUMU|nr:large-conductance mechanosensitive channel protein MscL [Leucothrix mucor]